MKSNLSALDRVIRVLLGAALLGVGLAVVKGLRGVVLGAVGTVLAYSGAVGFCHVYQFLGLSTAKEDRAVAGHAAKG